MVQRRPKVLVTIASFGQLVTAPKRMLDEGGYEVVNLSSGVGLSESAVMDAVSDVDAYVAGSDAITCRVIERADRLKVISRFGVGVDRVDIEAATRKGIVVTNTPGVMASSVADLAFALILGVARKVPYVDGMVRRGRWPVTVGTLLEGKVLGIVGLGSIGKQVARRAQGFGMTTTYHDLRPDEDFARRLGLTRCRDLDELLRTADFVSLHVPLDDSTRGLIGERELGFMKPTAYLVNTSRGAVVDEGALCQALAAGSIAGAGLDTFCVEPLRDSPLFEMDNVVLTAHMGSSTVETLNRMGEVAVRNALDVLEGKRPRFLVNPEVYERGGAGGAGLPSRGDG